MNESNSVQLWPSETHLQERFEYGGQVARSLTAPIAVRPCDVEALLELGFSRDAPSAPQPAQADQPA